MTTKHFMELLPIKFNPLPNIALDGWIRPNELSMMKLLCRGIESCVYLEIGTWEGYSAFMLKDFAKEVWCIDPTPTDSRYVNLFKYIIRPHHNIHLIREKSEIIGPLLKDDFFDVIFIDGDHHYEAVIKDLEMYYPKLKNEGYMLVHEYNHPSFPGPNKALKEFFGARGMFNPNFIETLYIHHKGVD